MSHTGSRNAVARVAAGALVAAGLALAPASPTSAAVVVTTAGTTFTVALTGAESIEFACAAGSVSLQGAGGTGSPAIPCTSVTSIVVTGDEGSQQVRTSAINASTFPALVSFSASMGGGGDYVRATPVADTINLGAGADGLEMVHLGPVDPAVDGGADSDTAYLYGSTSAETVTLTSGGTTLTAVVTIGAGSPVSRQLLNAEGVRVSASRGDDSIDATAISGASAVSNISLFGEDGNDTLRGSNAKGNYLDGGLGTNLLEGGAGIDALWSQGVGDTLRPKAGGDFLYDADPTGGALGSRVLDIAPGEADFWASQVYDGDSVQRVRPSPGATALVTSSLRRPGQQLLPSGIKRMGVGSFSVGDRPDRSMGDIVALTGVPIFFGGDGDDVLDITVPSGSWTILGDPEDTATITFDDGYGTITAYQVPQLTIHGPWATLNQGFAHRVIRDLQFRIPGAGERDGLRDQLQAGTRTRAQVVNQLMDTALYRGLDVDRAFVSILRREPDTGGRAYWIGRLDAGLGQRKLRANLLGSNEYFNKFGSSTNDGYVRAAYQDALGRQPDAAGLAYWVGVIEGGTPRGSVAERFLATPEARRFIVKDQFLRFLDRFPTVSESSTWVTGLAAPTGESALVAFLAGSSTYYLRS